MSTDQHGTGKRQKNNAWAGIYVGAMMIASETLGHWRWVVVGLGADQVRQEMVRWEEHC